MVSSSLRTRRPFRANGGVLPLLLLLFCAVASLLGASSVTAADDVDVDVDKTKSASEYLALGNRHLGNDDFANAVANYRKGIAASSSSDASSSSLVVRMSLHTNCATALSFQSENEQAIAHYKDALALHSASVDSSDDVATTSDKEASSLAAQAAFFLGLTYEETALDAESTDDGGTEDLSIWSSAANSYVLAVRLDPGHWSASANLGAVLSDRLRRPDDALASYNRAYRLLAGEEEEGVDDLVDPPGTREELYGLLSDLQYRVGLLLERESRRKDGKSKSRECAVEGTKTDCRDLAKNALALALRYDPNNEQARHELAAMTMDATVTRASNDYVTELFEKYAHNFEHSLVDELGYDGYARLRRGFDRALGGKVVEPFPVVVDAGCGTGLAGEQFRNVSAHLLGVDLSPSILEEAAKSRPGLYDDTRVGDLVEVFAEMRNEIHLIVAADSYIYFGDLEPLFAAMAEGAVDGGLLAFTLENVDEESEKSLGGVSPDWRWQLTASGRFAHRRDYVESVARRHSFRPFHYEPMDGFRHEHGVDVRGHLFVMRKEGRAERPRPEATAIDEEL